MQPFTDLTNNETTTSMTGRTTNNCPMLLVVDFFDSSRVCHRLPFHMDPPVVQTSLVDAPHMDYLVARHLLVGLRRPRGHPLLQHLHRRSAR